MPQKLPPASEPPPLPPAALLELAARGPILLCLDYDGTISELVSRPASARPIEGAVAAIRALAARPDRVAVAIVSGRPIAEIRTMTGLGDAVMYSGVHGLEIAAGHAPVRVADAASRCAPELERVRAWTARNVPKDAGFEIEDKRYSLALHYRNADGAAAAELRARFEEFVRANAPHLRAAHNKMVVEALPAAASKGEALRALCREAGAAFVPVYFGDDRTDEDAFAEVAGRGVGVLVGEARASLARWRVENPAAVVSTLETLAESLGPR